MAMVFRATNDAAVPFPASGDRRPTLVPAAGHDGFRPGAPSRSTGAGTTSLEADGDTFDGWTVPGPPAGSAPNADDWISGTVADTPPSLGVRVERTFARQGEILEFLAEAFGPYPFSASGGVVDDNELGFGMEVQTRPIYGKQFFQFEPVGLSVVVHELSHQWFGDSLTVACWQHVWLNEGFARYAEWLWSAT
jgi:hypothetical protein